jgi:hypothetical protein
LRCAMKTLKMSQEQERKRMEDLSFWSELWSGFDTENGDSNSFRDFTVHLPN